MAAGAALHDAHERNGDDLARKSFLRATEKLQRAHGRLRRNAQKKANAEIALASLRTVAATRQKNA
jgi:hypothetical protein